LLRSICSVRVVVGSVGFVATIRFLSFLTPASFLRSVGLVKSLSFLTFASFAKFFTRSWVTARFGISKIT
jgi:hypothetical protein